MMCRSAVVPGVTLKEGTPPVVVASENLLQPFDDRGGEFLTPIIMSSMLNTGVQKKGSIIASSTVI